jgi:hypothetical protein
MHWKCYAIQTFYRVFVLEISISVPRIMEIKIWALQSSIQLESLNRLMLPSAVKGLFVTLSFLSQCHVALSVMFTQ